MGTVRVGPLAELRAATAADHESVDSLVDPDRLVEVGYYAAVVGGLIEAAEAIEKTLPMIPSRLWSEGLSPAEVSKRRAIAAESAFLEDLTGNSGIRRPAGSAERLRVPMPPSEATMLGLLYVYVGSGLGGLHLLRFVRSASWWRPDREHLLLRPYGARLNERWKAVRDALGHLDAAEAGAAVFAARAAFDVHRRAVDDRLSIGVDR